MQYGNRRWRAHRLHQPGRKNICLLKRPPVRPQGREIRRSGRVLEKHSLRRRLRIRRCRKFRRRRYKADSHLGHKSIASRIHRRKYPLSRQFHRRNPAQRGGRRPCLYEARTRKTDSRNPRRCGLYRLVHKRKALGLRGGR